MTLRARLFGFHIDNAGRDIVSASRPIDCVETKIKIVPAALHRQTREKPRCTDTARPKQKRISGFGRNLTCPPVYLTYPEGFTVTDSQGIAPYSAPLG